MDFAEERLVKPEDRPMIFADRRVKYLDSDVLTEAKKRIRHVINTHDAFYVAFSGGKDSLVVMHLVREVMDEDGMQDIPLTLAFRDEELIPDDVIEFVQSFRERPDRWNLAYFAFPMESHLFFMGRHLPYVQWDEARRGRWMREKPAYAIERIHPENVPIHQTMTSSLMVQALGLRGKVAIFNGIRAQESLTRFRASTAKVGRESYIAADQGGSKNINFVKPIYDWSERDVFRFFYDRGISYCKIYEAEMYAGAPLRVSTPLHDAAYDYLTCLRSMYPVFFSQMCDIWPEVIAQERYWKDYDKKGIIESYPKSFEGIMQFIKENLHEPAERKKAMEVVQTCWKARERNRLTGKYAGAPGYGYPILHVFKAIVTGKFMKGVQAYVAFDKRYDDYEKMAEAEANGG